MQPKAEIRQIILEQRATLTSTFVKAESERINTLLWKEIEQRNCSVLHSYLPFRNEVDVFPLLHKAIDNNIRVVAPKTLPKRQLQHLIYKGKGHVSTGKFNTFYPSGKEEYSGSIDIILVPGLAFTQKGDRLGFGAGYYDTFLENHPEAMKIGVAYPFQVLDHVPTEAHDVRLDKVIF